MPLKKYGVLKGIAVDRRFATKSNAHYQVKLVDEDDEWRIAVNVQSADKSEVEYLIIPDFEHPITKLLETYPLGFTELPKMQDGLDYIRSNMFNPANFLPLPMNVSGPDNDLNDKLDHYIQQAMNNEGSFIYAFGEPWGPEKARDSIFGFKPGRGIHDIHMNQGNSGAFQRDNGVWQDGGLIFYFPQEINPWVAIFLKFQTQTWHTNETTGNPLTGKDKNKNNNNNTKKKRLTKKSIPTEEEPHGLIRIVAALVNDGTTQQKNESVTIINTSDQKIDLTGWQLLDTKERIMNLSGTIEAGDTKRIFIRPCLELPNKGGLITLLNTDGLKVDGVNYTQEQIQNGRTILFS